MAIWGHHLRKKEAIILHRSISAMRAYVADLPSVTSLFCRALVKSLLHSNISHAGT
jgi:hypothetical protein